MNRISTFGAQVIKISSMLRKSEIHPIYSTDDWEGENNGEVT